MQVCPGVAKETLQVMQNTKITHFWQLHLYNLIFFVEHLCALPSREAEPTSPPRAEKLSSTDCPRLGNKR